MMEWKTMIILLLFIQSTSGQRPSAPTSVVMELEFINANPHITGRWNAPVGTTVEQYLLAVTVNGSSSFNTTVLANITSVNIFEVFPNIIQRRYTTYSLRVASISNVGQSYFTEPVSIVSNILQSASVTGGVRKIVASCVIANSKPNALCTVVVSDNTEHHAYTFQTGETHVTLDYTPGEYHASIRTHEKIDGNFVITEESTSWSIFVLPVTPSSSSTAVLSSTVSFSPLSLSATSLLLTSPSTSSLTVSNGNDGSGRNGGSSEVSTGAVMVTVLVCALILSLTVMFTVAALIWWKCHINRKGTSDTTTAKVPEKSCAVHSTVNTKTDTSSFCEELDTIKDERYSVVTVGGGKSRINSALTSNHSSYIEMHPRVSVGYLAAANNVIMQPNPSYS